MAQCPTCNEEYTLLGSHWNYNPTHRPELTKQQKQIVTGVLMSDGWLRTSSSGNSRLCIESITKKYLEYLKDEFECLGTNVKLKETASKSAKNARSSGFRPEAKAKNYNNIYKWQTRSLPELSEYASWYQKSGKVWPDDLELTSTVLKHLYAGDGTYQEEINKISIALRNEQGNKDKIENYFIKAGLPKPKWHEPLDENGEKLCNIYWYGDDSNKIFEYMGTAVPGFGYKWL